jgi:CheY-like chemotaxis protein
MPKKILVVDDSFEDLEQMKAVLEKAGYSVKAATNGAEALDVLRADGFELILIDIKMPTLSGYDLLRLLRERLNHNSKMVYVSIVPKKEVAMDDVDGFVQKPFNEKSLLAEIKRVLGK